MGSPYDQFRLHVKNNLCWGGGQLNLEHLIMTLWQPKSVKRIDDVKDTSTGAARVVTDIGYGWVKAMGNPEGPHALACELLGTRLAAWLGLRTFDVAIVEMDDAVRVQYKNGSFSSPGPAFIAREIEGRSWGGDSEDIASNVCNVEHVSGLVVFDTWTRNCDRFLARTNRCNLRNVFLTSDGAAPGKRAIMAIDHTACFRLDSELTKRVSNIDNVKDETVYGLFDGFVPHITTSRVRQFAEKLLTITEMVVKHLIHEIPREWDVSDDIRENLREFILRRAEFVGRNIIRWLQSSFGAQPLLPGFGEK